MTTISRFEIDGEISSLRGGLGSWHKAALVDPPGSNVLLWSLGSKQYNHYVIDSVNSVNIIMPEISQTSALLGYNVTIINSSINTITIRDFNNNFILDLMPKKCVKLIASDLLQNWTFSSTVLRNNASLGVNLLENSIANSEYSFKNLISSDSSVVITDLSNQIDLKATIPPNPPGVVLDIYLSIFGSDSNDGLTPATPVLTLNRALEISNQLGWNDQVTFNFGPGNHVLPNGEGYVFKYTPLGLNDGAYVFKGSAPLLVNSFAVSSTNNVTLAPTQFAMVNPGAAMVPDAYNGLSILMTSGANSGKYYQISENTATEIYLLTTDVFGIGDTFNIYVNVSKITTHGNRFSDGYIIMSNIDIVLDDRIIVHPNEIYSWEIIDTFMIYDNVRILTNPAVNNPYILYYGSTFISSDNTHVFSNFYVSSNLGSSFNGSNLTNPGTSIQMFYINSFVSTSQVYFNRAAPIFQNSQVYSFLFYFKNTGNIQTTSTDSYFGQVVFRDCDSPNALLQIQNNTSLYLDGVLQLGTTTILTATAGTSTFYVNNGNFALLNVIGGVDGLSSLNFNNVTINNMIGTDPNRTFSHSNIILNNCNITSPAQTINFNCCTCTTFDTVTISGDLEFIFNNSSIAFNNYTSNSANPLIFNNCRIIASNMNFEVASSGLRLSLNQCISTFDTINLSEVNLGGFGLSCIDTVIYINNLNVYNPGNNPLYAIGFTNCTVTINNFNLNNINSQFSLQASNSTINNNNLTSTVPNTSFNFSLENTKYNLTGSLNHDGNLLGNTYFTLNNNSFLRVNSLNYNNCQDQFCSVGTLSSLLIDNGNLNNIGKFLTKSSQSFNLVQINNTNFNNVSSVSDFMDLQGGKIVINTVNVNMTAVASNYIFNLDNCDFYANNFGVDSNVAGCFNLEKTCKLKLINANIKATPNTPNNGIQCDHSDIYIDTVNFDNYENGLNLIHKSSGVYNSNGGSNVTYGLVLLSGSSISQNSANTTNGGVGEVLVGALGNRTWVLVNGGLAADTNDYTTANPQYVFIAPA